MGLSKFADWVIDQVRKNCVGQVLRQVEYCELTGDTGDRGGIRLTFDTHNLYLALGPGSVREIRYEGDGSHKE